jgi:hypothetical protein
MTLADFSIVAFAVFNGARLVSYVPQIVCIKRDPHGAAAVSLTTWGLFTMAHFATVSYALVVSGDVVMAGVFTWNMVGCMATFALTVKKRIAHQGSL